MNRPKELDLKNLISWGGSKNPAFFDFTGNFVEFSCKVKSPPGRIALRRRGKESTAQALISFGVARKRENVPYFLAIRGDVWWAENGANKDVFSCKTEPFFSKGIMIK